MYKKTYSKNKIKDYKQELSKFNIEITLLKE